MGRTMMAVFSNPTSPDEEEEYNAWYDTVHLKELLELPEILSATRYRLTEPGDTTSPTHRYLAIYELDSTPDTVLAKMASHTSAPSPALDAAGVRIEFWEPVEVRSE